MAANWLIESFKWKYVIRKIEPVSLTISVKAVFSGITFGIFTPNRIGELAGRVFVLQKHNRTKAIFATGVGSLSQVIITLIAGATGIIFLLTNSKISFFSDYKIAGISAFIITISTLVIYFKLSIIERLFRKLKFIQKYFKAVEVLRTYSFCELLQILTFSLLRYFIFILQLYFLLLYFEIKIPLLFAFTSAASAFFVNTVIPSIALADVGIRGSTALFFFGMYSDNEPGILTASFLLWFINLMIPAVIGSLFFARTQLY